MDLEILSIQMTNDAQKITINQKLKYLMVRQIKRDP